jgi:hypothetical protein
MSSAPSKGEGDVGLSILHNSTGRKAFLRRNVRKSLRHLTMGSALTKITASMGAKPSNPFDPRDLDGDEDEDGDGNPRPTKRRRINTVDWEDGTMQGADDSNSRQPLGQLTSNNERSRAVKPGMVQPSDFYGKSKSKLESLPPVPLKKALTATDNTKFHIDDIIPESLPVDFTKSLRVDIKEINLKPSSEYPDEFVENDSYIPCRVAAGIFYCQDEDNKKSEEFTELCKSVQLGILHVTVAENGSFSRQFIKLEPFFFSSEDFFVRRKKRKPNGQWGGFENTWGLADRYRLIVTIESTKFHMDWPSLVIPEGGDVEQAINDDEYIASDFQMYARTNLGSRPDRHTKIPLFLQHVNHHKTLSQSIPYTLSIQARWSIPNTLKNAALEAPKSEFPTTVMPSVPVPTAINVPTADDTAVNTADASEVDSTLAANRARRDRKAVSTYNLKRLSTIAQGKSPRKERPKEPISEETGMTTVTYSIHHGDAADTGVKQRTIVQGLACGFCDAPNRTVEDLRLHLHTEHGAFKFSYRHGPPRVQFFVEIVKPRVGPMVDIDRAKTFQMIKTKSLFDLEKYLSGEAWIKSRQGPQHGLWPDHLQERAHESSSSASPHDSRYSSPNTSHSADDDMMDDEMYNEKPPERPRKVILVPKTAKPLYHSITKRVLIPGEELPQSDDEKEESWLDQKHRDLVNDFTDVTTDEKDYINGGWNPFITKQGLTSPEYLPAAIMRFVELKKDWFAEKSSRKTEFALHMKVFILRGNFTHNAFYDCMEILKKAEEAKKQREKENAIMKDPEPEKPVSKSRGIQSCICGNHTEPPNRVICVGEVSLPVSSLNSNTNTTTELPSSILL